MENLDYLVFVIKNLRHLSYRDKGSLLLLMSKEISRDASISEVRSIISGFFQKSHKSMGTAFTAAEDELRLAEKTGTSFITLADSRYPELLKEIYDPPFVLYYRGDLSSLNRRRVAVVGTRLARGASKEAAYELGFTLGRNGVAAVSGLARGIDAAAHRGNLDGGMSTIAVLGTGVDVMFPAENQRLGYRILENGGVIVSELMPGTHGTRFTFPQRNRIISGLSAAVVVVQAPARSGALITAEFAAEQGRDVFIHSACIGSSEGIGGESLMLDGVMSVSSGEDVLEKLGWPVENPGCCFRTDSDVNPCRFLELELDGKIINHCGIYYIKGEKLGEKVYA